MDVYIENLQKKVKINRDKINLVALTTLASLKKRKGRINLIFVNKPCIRKLNKKFRHRDKITDVLAFNGPLKLAIASPEKKLLGEIIVCPGVAQENYKKYNTPLKEELYRYVIHGILHLLGYRDDTLKNRRKMWDKQEEILRKITNPKLQIPNKLQ